MRKKEVMKETGKNEEGNDRECTKNNIIEMLNTINENDALFIIYNIVMKYYLKSRY